MCGITFRKASRFSDYFLNAHLRGTDWFGIVRYSRGNIQSDSDTKLFNKESINNLSIFRCIDVDEDKKKWFSSFATIDWKNKYTEWTFRDGEELTYTYLKSSFYDKLVSYYINKKKPADDEYLLLHHRKGVYGSNSIDNVHPFEGDRFILLQNGSSKAIHNWGIIEFLWEEDKTDSYYILKYIEKHNASDIKEALWLVEQISKCAKDEVGVVVVVDKLTKEIGFYMDWARSLYIDISADWESIEYISSLKDKSLLEYFNKGKLIIDFDGKIIENHLEKGMNYTKVTQYQTPITWSREDYKKKTESSMTNSKSESTGGNLKWTTQLNILPPSNLQVENFDDTDLQLLNMLDENGYIQTFWKKNFFTLDDAMTYFNVELAKFWALFWKKRYSSALVSYTDSALYSCYDMILKMNGQRVKNLYDKRDEEIKEALEDWATQFTIDAITRKYNTLADDKMKTLTSYQERYASITRTLLQTQKTLNWSWITNGKA